MKWTIIEYKSPRRIPIPVKNKKEAEKVIKKLKYLNPKRKYEIKEVK